MNAYWSTLSKFKIQNMLEDVCIYWSTNFEFRKQTRREKISVVAARNYQREGNEIKGPHYTRC